MLTFEQLDVKPLLRTESLRDYVWTIPNTESTTAVTDLSEKEKIFTIFKELSRRTGQLKNPTSETTKSGTPTDKTKNYTHTISFTNLCQKKYIT